MNNLSQPGRATSVQLRLLATTDLHMHLTDWDYAKDQPMRDGGLVRLAAQIAEARVEAEARGARVLLFDNGDGLQGTVLADLAMNAVADGQDHVLMQAFAHLDYDAIGLGNHDFDYGIERLEQSLTAAPCPVICSNLERQEPGILKSVRDGVILQAGPVRIGVLSALPPQTMFWNADRLAGRVTFGGIADTLEAGVARLREQGCDTIVVLAHSGLGKPQRRVLQENAVRPVAALDHIAAIFGGHTHLPFAGRVAGSDVPLALAGHAGRYLAQIDLELTRTETGTWAVTGSDAVLRPADQTDEGAVPGLRARLNPWHRKAREQMAEPAGHSDTHLHSYFAMVRPDTHLHLIAEAQRAAFDKAVSERPDLPVLSAVAPGKCGGRGGPEHYVDIPAGPVQRRHIEELIVFPNLLRAVVLNGACLRDWLEMSASVFLTITPGADPSDLLNPDWPPPSA